MIVVVQSCRVVLLAVRVCYVVVCELVACGDPCRTRYLLGWKVGNQPIRGAPSKIMSPKIFDVPRELSAAPYPIHEQDSSPCILTAKISGNEDGGRAGQ